MKKIIIYLGIITIITFSSFKTFTDWFLYKTNEYTILFPKKPTEETKFSKTNSGEVEVNTATYKAQNINEDNLKYLISSNKIPIANNRQLSENEKEIFFDNGIKGSIRNHKAELIFDKKISISGNSGHHVKMIMHQGKIIVNMKIYLVKNIYYGNVVYTFKEKDDNENINTFFDSFKLN